MQLIDRLAPTVRGQISPTARYYISMMGSGGGSLWVALSASKSRLYVLSAGEKPKVHVWPDNRLNVVGISAVGPKAAYVWTTDGRLLATGDAGANWTQIP